MPYSFKNCVAYALKHYSTTIHEIEDIVSDFPSEIKEHHCVRLRNIGRVADQINTDIGQIWHRRDLKKEYEKPNFLILEDVYTDTRDMAVNLSDIDNIANRLDQFVGRKTMVNNPWMSGSFYLLATVIFLMILTVISIWVSWYTLPIVVIGGVLLVGAIGALQLRNDDRLKEENFIKLMLEVFKRLPLLVIKEKKRRRIIALSNLIGSVPPSCNSGTSQRSLRRFAYAKCYTQAAQKVPPTPLRQIMHKKNRKTGRSNAFSLYSPR